jgi:hypothetical protein
LLDLTRQRFDAGVTDNVEVVQAQESLTSAELDLINSVFAHNLAKLSLAPCADGAVPRVPRVVDVLIDLLAWVERKRDTCITKERENHI